MRIARFQLFPRTSLVACSGALLLLPALMARGAGRQPDPRMFFESKVRPLLLEKCATCHGPKLQQGRLRVDSREALLKGGANGPTLVPGDPEASPLIRALSHMDPGLKMPPDRKLRPDQIADLTAWVKMGAPWPTPGGKGSGAGGKGRLTIDNSQLSIVNSGGTHWAFRSVKRPGIPLVRNRAWVKSPIDAFVLAGLEKAGVKPAMPADRRTLIRRATFDLTGLPPTPGEVDAFLADRSPNAWEKVVDRLLASPRYGEKWGRYWLDCVRYADTNGLDENYHYAYAWRYRDYVIDAFNRDLPYDRFVQEQLAGDLQPPSPEPQENYRRITATGFLMVGPKLLANPDKQQVLLDIIDEQVDVTSRVFMGVTLSCARCHDHKFDPFTQRDYTAFAGILKSTRTMISLKDRKWSEVPLAPADVVAQAEAHQKALDEAKKTLQGLQKKKAEPARQQELEARIAALEKSAPPPVPYALAVIDGEPEDLPLYIRGDHNQPAAPVKRGFPAVLAGNSPQTFRGSGRLEFARWLTHPEHPLTARVMVNRVWQGHFGRGLVATSDNFGSLGEKPTHPELLDWLASSFVAGAGGRGAGGRGYGVQAEYGSTEGTGARGLGAGEPVGQEKYRAAKGKGAGAKGAGVPVERNRYGLSRRRGARVKGAGERGALLTATAFGSRGSHYALRNTRYAGGSGYAIGSTHYGSPGPQPPTPGPAEGLGWSTKRLHKLILMSNTYRMSNRPDPAAMGKDPENRLYSRFERRRLQGEEIRDAILAINGRLDLKMGGSILDFPNFTRVTTDDSSDFAAKVYETPRRTVYLPVVRNSLFELLELFDFADPSAVTTRRSETVVPTQALFLMNHPLVLEWAREWAGALEAVAAEDRVRITEAFRRAYGRPPRPDELDRGLRFLGEYAAEVAKSGTARDEARRKAWQSYCQILFCSNEFLYVD